MTAWVYRFEAPHAVHSVGYCSGKREKLVFRIFTSGTQYEVPLDLDSVHAYIADGRVVWENIVFTVPT